MAAAVQTAKTRASNRKQTETIRLAVTAPQKPKKPALNADAAESLTSITSSTVPSRTDPAGRPSARCVPRGGA